MILFAGAVFAADPPVGAPAGATPAAEAAPEGLPLLTGPEVASFVEAVYPPEALAAGLGGTVGLLVEVGVEGSVTRVDVLRPAGHGFDEAAVAAVRQFTFRPATDATGPVVVEVEFDYPFVPPPAVEEVPPPEALPVTLEGQLTEMATKVPVAGGVVIARDLAGREVAQVVADDRGHYAFAGLPPGSYRLTARRPGYQDAAERADVVAGQVTTARLWLRNESYRDNEAVAVYERERAPEVTRRTLSIAEVRRVPGSFGDPVRVIQNLPGAARAPFSTGLLVLRGANPEDSNVYVDGVEVPLVYHLGGFRSILNPELIEAVDYLPGTYGVRYGRSIGGVIDVRTQQDFPERPHLTLRTDILDTGLYGEGRFGKWGWAAGARHSYVDVVLGIALAGQAFYAAPRWLDYQAKLQWLGDGPDEFSVLLFGFDDLLTIRLGEAEDQQAGVGYGTHRLVVRWERELADDLTLRLQPAVGFGTTDIAFGSALSLKQNDQVFDLRGDVRWEPSAHFTLSAGLDSEVSRNDFEVFLASVPVDGENPLSESEPLVAGAGLWLGQPDPFVEAQVRPLADPEALALVAGARLPVVVRASEDDPGGESDGTAVAVDPRIAVRTSFVTGGTFKAGTGLYHQPPSGTTLGGELEFERAWSSEAGWEQKFGPAVQVDLTGYYRWMEPLSVGTGEEYGVGRAYGMEFMARHALVDRFFGWVSYTLSTSERNDTPDDPEGWYRFDYDQTHIATAVAGYRLPLDFEVSAKAQYTTGNPYTPYDGGIYMMDEGGYVPYATGAPNSARQPDYWAVDVRLDKLFTWKNWQLEVFVDLLNLAHGENPEFILYNYDYTEHDWVSGLPFIPSVGFQAEWHL